MEETQTEQPAQENLTPETPPVQETPKDRTAEQFDKLKEHNKELKDELTTYKTLLDTLTAQSNTPDPHITPEAASTSKDLLDEGGYINGQKLLDKIENLEKKLSLNEQRLEQKTAHEQREKAAQQRARIADKIKRLHDKYPQTDPTRTDIEYDQALAEAIEGEITRAFASGVPVGEEDPVSYADKWYQKLYGSQTDMTKKEKEEQTKKEDQKRQINATRPRSSSQLGYYESEEEDALVKKIQKGKRGAVAEMLRRMGQ